MHKKNTSKFGLQVMKQRIKVYGAISFLSVLFCSSLNGQPLNFSNKKAYSGETTRLGIYTGVQRNCVIQTMLPIRIVRPPKHGELIIQPTMYSSDKIMRCPHIKASVQIVFYRSKQDYEGPDEVIYQTINTLGLINSYGVAITVGKKPYRPNNSSFEQDL